MVKKRIIAITTLIIILLMISLVFVRFKVFGYTDYTDTSTGIIWRYDGEILIGVLGTVPTNLTIPSYINGQKITQLSLSGAASNLKTLNVESITFPSTITAINSNVFYGNSNITSITFTGGSVSIGNLAFRGCTNLATINGTSYITSIGDQAFYGCTSLTNVTGMSNLQTIGSSAFSGCTALTSVEKMSNLQTIGSSVFDGCTSLQTLDLSSIVDIPDWTCYNCSSLTSITLSNGNVSIGEYAFDSCENLTTVNGGTNIVSFGYMAFKDCAKLKYLNLNNATYFGGYCLYDCVELETNLSINSNCTYIGLCAFNETKVSGNIVIPQSVTTLDRSAFYKTAINSISFSEGIATIPSGLCYGCTNLETVNFPNSLTSIGASSFYGCSALKEVVIPDNVTFVGEIAFYECKQLEKLVIGDGITELSSGGEFGYCRNLKELEIGNGLLEVKEYNGYGDPFVASTRNLEKITIGDSFIGKLSRFASPYLDSINISANNSKYIVDNGIAYTKDLTELSLYPGGNTTTSIEINNVSTIGERAFFYTRYLNTIELGENVTKISDGAFMGDGLISSVGLDREINNSIDTITILNRDCEIGEGIATYRYFNVKSYRNTPIENYVLNEKSSLEKITFVGIDEYYNLTLNTNGGTINSEGDFTQYLYGTETILPTDITKLGYTFDGWYGAEDFTGEAVTKIEKTDIGDKQFYAKWSLNNNIPYKVEYYKENLTLDGYEIDEEATFNGTGYMNQEVTAEKINYEGFEENTIIADRKETGSIAVDGSLVLKLYYDRIRYDVILNKNGGSVNSGALINYAHGVGATLPTSVSKPGYTFGGWYLNNDYTGEVQTSIASTETGSREYWAKWIPKSNISYKIEHYLLNKTLDEYEIDESLTENETGTTEEIVSASAKTIVGFTENTTYSERKASGQVLGDGSLALRFYYDRNEYNVTLNTMGADYIEEDLTAYVYGVGATLPENIEKKGYTFAGWYLDSEATGERQVSISETDIGDKTYYAVWNVNNDTAYKVEYYKQTSDNYVLEEIKEFTGTTGAKAIAEEVEYDGYVLNNVNSIKEGIIAGDGSLVLKLYYDKNTEVKYKIEHYKQGKDSYILQETEEKTGTAFDEVIATFKEYAGYNVNLLHSETVRAGVITPDEKLVLKLYYDRATNTGYVVEHYKETDTEYVVTKKEYLTGTTDTEVTAMAKEIPGYTENTSHPDRVASGTVAGDGSLVLKLYYDRNTNTKYTVEHYKQNENGTYDKVESLTESLTGITDSTVIAEAKTILGYTENISHPDRVASGTVAADGSLVLKLYYDRNTNTKYTVEYYFRTTDAEVEYYALDSSKTLSLTGTTDTVANAEQKEFEGFTQNTSHPDRVASGIIAGDGSLVLKLYYDRNIYNITYELNGGTKKGSLTNSYTYGKELILSNKVEKQGYVFGGWYDNSSFEGTAVTKILATETGNKTFYAKWISDEQYYIISEKHDIDEQEKYITKVSPNTNVQTLISNLNTNGTAKVLDAKGEELAKDALVGTGCKVQVDYKGAKYEYEVAVRGDIDGNGKITVTDLSMLNQVLVKKLTVTGIKEKATDIDYSGKITVTDLSMMNQALVGKTKL